MTSSIQFPTRVNIHFMRSDGVAFVTWYEHIGPRSTKTREWRVTLDQVGRLVQDIAEHGVGADDSPRDGHEQGSRTEPTLEEAVKKLMCDDLRKELLRRSPLPSPERDNPYFERS